MKSFFLAIVAGILIVGCGESELQHMQDHATSHSDSDPISREAKPSPAEEKSTEPLAAAAQKTEGARPASLEINRKLLLAAHEGRIADIKQTIADGADVNARDKAGWTPLHYSAAEDRKEIAELLLAAGADLNARDKAGIAPLHQAAYSGHKKIAEFFISKGADVNAKINNGWTSLHGAVFRGHKEIVELLVDKGADVNVKNDDGETPLDRADGAIADLLRKLGGKTAEESGGL